MLKCWGKGENGCSIVGGKEGLMAKVVGKWCMNAPGLGKAKD